MGFLMRGSDSNPETVITRMPSPMISRRKNTACTIGYFLNRTYWNRVINTRCVKAVCEFALRDMNLVIG